MALHSDEAVPDFRRGDRLAPRHKLSGYRTLSGGVAVI